MAALARALGAKGPCSTDIWGPPLPGVEPDEAQLRYAIRGSGRCGGSAGTGTPNLASNMATAPASASGVVVCGLLGWRVLCTIDPWGNLRPCNHSPLVVGNVLETPSMCCGAQEAMDRWRAFVPAECSQCGELATCHGGCRAMIEIRDLAGIAWRPAHYLPSSIHSNIYEGARPAAFQDATRAIRLCAYPSSALHLSHLTPTQSSMRSTRQHP